MNHIVDTPLEPMDRYIAAILNLTPDAVLYGAPGAPEKATNRLREAAPLLMTAALAAALAAVVVTVLSRHEEPRLPHTPAASVPDQPRAMTADIRELPVTSPVAPMSRPSLRPEDPVVASDLPDRPAPSEIPRPAPRVSDEVRQVAALAPEEEAVPRRRIELPTAQARSEEPDLRSSFAPEPSQERRDAIDALNIIRQR